jgi:hypothetical protein
VNDWFKTALSKRLDICLDCCDVIRLA